MTKESDNAKKRLQERRSVLEKYGRLPLKPGFNKSKQRMPLLDF